MPDFKYNQTPAFSQVMELVANQRLKEQQIRESQQNVQKSQADIIRGVASDASAMVNGMVTAAREKQKQSALKDLSGMFATADKPSPGVLPEGVAGPQPRYMTPRQDPAFNDRARSLLIQAAPDVATKQMAESLFPDRSSMKFQQAAIQDPVTGEVKLSVFDPSTGTYSQGEETKGYMPKIMIDPTTGQPIRIDSQGKATPVQSAPQGKKVITDYADLNPFQRKFVDRTSEDYDSDKTVESARTKLTGISQAMEALSSKNPFGDAAVAAFMARAAGDVGNLSEYEQKNYSVSPSLLNRAKTFFTRGVEGLKTEEDRKDLLKIMQIYQRKQTDAIDRRKRFYANKIKSRIPNVSDEVITPLFGNEELPSFKSTIGDNTSDVDAAIAEVERQIKELTNGSR